MADRESTTEDRAEKTAARPAGTARQRPWLRRVGVVVSFLFAGAIINVLVAWGCAAYSRSVEELPRPIALIEFFDKCEWTFISHQRALGLTRHSLIETFHEPEIELAHTSKFLEAQLNGEDLHERIIDFPRWSRLGTTASDPFLEVEHEVAAGWPLRALWGSQYENRREPITGDRIPRNYNPPTSLRISRWTTPKFGVHSLNVDQLPLVPILPGFLINTVFYGAIVWMLFATPLVVRRHRRVKRSQCASCAYDLRGADHGKCPECGEAVGA